VHVARDDVHVEVCHGRVGMDSDTDLGEIVAARREVVIGSTCVHGVVAGFALC